MNSTKKRISEGGIFQQLRIPDPLAEFFFLHPSVFLCRLLTVRVDAKEFPVAVLHCLVGRHTLEALANGQNFALLRPLLNFIIQFFSFKCVIWLANLSQQHVRCKQFLTMNAFHTLTNLNAITARSAFVVI
jgi:hypothetical protein